MKKRRSFSNAFKARVVLEVLSGQRSKAEACRHYQIKDSLLSRWTKQFLERAPSLFETKHQHRTTEPQRVAELERMVGRLMMELDLAKKASHLFRSTIDIS